MKQTFVCKNMCKQMERDLVNQRHSIEYHLDQSSSQHKRYHYRQKFEGMFHSPMVWSRLDLYNIEYHSIQDNNQKSICQCSNQN
jgi:hypothetical protein